MRRNRRERREQRQRRRRECVGLTLAGLRRSIRDVLDAPPDPFPLRFYAEARRNPPALMWSQPQDPTSWNTPTPIPFAAMEGVIAFSLQFVNGGVMRCDVPRAIRGDDESAVAQEHIDALMDLARADRRDDFMFLAGAVGVDPAKHDELWNGARARLVPAPPMSEEDARYVARLHGVGG